MSEESIKVSPKDGSVKRTLARRDFFKLGFAGAVLSYLNTGCQKETATEQPYQPKEIYELTDGKSMYDDFDGNGNLQTYNNQNLAEAGKLSSKLWQPMSGAEVVQDSAARDLLTVVNEEGRRVEYRVQEKPQQVTSGQKEVGPEKEFVYDADGNLIGAFRHIPGRPYHASRRLLWMGAKNGCLETETGRLVVQKGLIYGVAQAVSAKGRGWVLRISSLIPGLMACLLHNPRNIDFADFKTFSADVSVSSSSTAQDFHASLVYHTTIPEQPPGKSWFTELGIHKYASGEAFLFAQCCNMNMGSRVYLDLGQARLDKWYSLRSDIVTRTEDRNLRDNEFRIDYYVDGVLKESDVPEDSELLLDPQRTGYGPNRYMIIYADQATGECIAYFDNVRAVYRNRLS